jgi:hypothetical protein
MDLWNRSHEPEKGLRALLYRRRTKLHVNEKIDANDTAGLVPEDAESLEE